MALMNFLKKKNNATGKLIAPLEIGGSTFTLEAGQGNSFPTSNFLVSGNDEIIYVTSRVGDTFNCIREQEGTSAQFHATGAVIQLRITAGTLKEYEDAINQQYNDHQTHIAETTSHGATGGVVGATKTQTLTNKTLVSPVIGDFSNANHSHSSAGQGGVIITVPSGVYFPFGGVTLPDGYLWCNGASYLRSEYPTLFAAIGTRFGSADADHFNVPNMEDRLPMGASSTKAVGSTGGSDTINIAHTHTVNSHNHGIQSGGEHHHYFSSTTGVNVYYNESSNTYSVGTSWSPPAHRHGVAGNTGGVSAYHSHGCDTSAPGTSSQLTTNQSVINKYVASNYIIKI